MSDTEQDTPGGVVAKPSARWDEDRELAERLVAEANEQGLDLVGRPRPGQAWSRSPFCSGATP